MGISIVKIRQSWDRLNWPSVYVWQELSMGIPILMRWHSQIETVPCAANRRNNERRETLYLIAFIIGLVLIRCNADCPRHNLLHNQINSIFAATARGIANAIKKPPMKPKFVFLLDRIDKRLAMIRYLIRIERYSARVRLCEYVIWSTNLLFHGFRLYDMARCWIILYRVYNTRKLMSSAWRGIKRMAKIPISI